MRNLAVKPEAFVYFIYKLLMAVISILLPFFFRAQSQAHIESPTTSCRLIQWVTRPPRPIPTRACQPPKGIVFFPNKFVHVRINKSTEFQLTSELDSKDWKGAPGKDFCSLERLGLCQSTYTFLAVVYQNSPKSFVRLVTKWDSWTQ